MIDPHEAKACHNLWVAVLLENLRTALMTRKPMNSAMTELDVHKARRWIGSKGFREVCHLADFNPDLVEAWVRRELEELDHGATLRRLMMKAAGRQAGDPGRRQAVKQRRSRGYG